MIRANIKVSSTETGVIFGNIVYEGTGWVTALYTAVFSWFCWMMSSAYVFLVLSWDL